MRRDLLFGDYPSFPKLYSFWIIWLVAPYVIAVAFKPEEAEGAVHRELLKGS